MRLLNAAILGLCLGGVVAAQDFKPFAGEVSANALNLRAGPGEAYQSVVRMQHGSKLIVLGQHANNSAWYQVEVPQGYQAWLSAEFVVKGKDGIGEIKANRVLVRPRPSTRYHQLSGRLNAGESVKIVGERRTDKEGLWYLVEVPRRIPLYAYAKFIQKIGPPEMARVPAKGKATPDQALVVDVPQSPTDKRFRRIEPQVRAQMERAKATIDITPLRRTVAEIDSGKLSLDNRERRVRLLADILEKERQFSISEVRAKEDEVNAGLERKLAEIERSYRKRIAEILDRFEKEKKRRYVATGIVKWRPDVVGRYPSYRIVEAGKMRYYLIATHYDLRRFVNKRVGVIGITDPESGTGFETIMVKRIEILGDQ